MICVISQSAGAYEARDDHTLNFNFGKKMGINNHSSKEHNFRAEVGNFDFVNNFRT